MPSLSSLALFVVTAAAPTAAPTVSPASTVSTVSPPPSPIVTAEPSGWDYAGVYWLVGVAPGTTFRPTGFNPMIRFDTEIGMHWRRNKWTVGYGADAWLLQSLERKKVGGGVHGVVTVTRRPVYVRAGVGALTGIPASGDDHDVRPAIGALIGAGLEGGGSKVVGRFGVDYHLSLDKGGRLNNTVLLTMRFKFG